MPLNRAAYGVHFAMGLPAWGDAIRAASNAPRWKAYGGYRTPPRSLEARSRLLEADSADDHSD